MSRHALKLQELEFILGQTVSGGIVRARHLANPHVYISGSTGSGKSVFLRYLLGQVMRQEVCCLVLDYSDDFSGYLPPDGIPFYRTSVVDQSFSTNPLAYGRRDPARCAQQLISTLTQVFRMGPKTVLKLLQVTQDYLEAGTEPPTILGLCRYAESNATSKNGLIPAMEPVELLAHLIHCGEELISLDLVTPGLRILDFSQIQGHQLRKIMLEIVLSVVWMQRCGGTETARSGTPLLILMDEAQNLVWKEESAAVRILREGRKYDIGGWFCSQWIKNETAVAALRQSALQAHFHPDDASAVPLAKMLGADERDAISVCRQHLQTLQVGQFLWLGPKRVPVKVIVPQAP